jgi:hypothetical protein
MVRLKRADGVYQHPRRIRTPAFNISTATALVVAGAGVPTSSTERAVSGKSGSTMPLAATSTRGDAAGYEALFEAAASRFAALLFSRAAARARLAALVVRGRCSIPRPAVNPAVAVSAARMLACQWR